MQIGDENLHRVRALMDEVFGERNFVAIVTLTKAASQSSSLLPSVNDFLIWFAKDRDTVKYRPLLKEKAPIERAEERYICAEEADGTVLGWIMNQAHSRAIDRRRFDHRQKRVESEAGDPFPATGTAHPDDLIAFKQQSQALGNALVVLTPDERHAIEATFFSELMYAEVAARLNEPRGTIKTRIRSGLHKLRGPLAEGGSRP
jgi:RNA polymerase sigma factor (sigma-70 family)